MATRFIDKEYGANTSTAIANDATGTRKVQNLPDAAGFVYDTVDNTFKFNAAGTIKTLADTSTTQTFTNKTLTSPTITGSTLTTATLTSPILTTPTGTTATEVVTATNVIAAAESGTTYFLNSTVEFVSTLPAPAAGVNFTFIVTAAPSGASYTIVTAQSGSACEIIVGHVLTSDVYTDSAVDADSEKTLGATTISFVDSKAVIGDKCFVISDGTNWYASAMCANVDGITFTG